MLDKFGDAFEGKRELKNHLAIVVRIAAWDVFARVVPNDHDKHGLVVRFYTELGSSKMGEKSSERNANVYGCLLALAFVVFGDKFYPSNHRHTHVRSFRMPLDEYENVKKRGREARVPRSSRSNFSLARERWIFSQRVVGHRRVVWRSESFVFLGRRTIFDQACGERDLVQYR